MEELMELIKKLDDKDISFIRQVIALIYRYLEKRGRI